MADIHPMNKTKVVIVSGAVVLLGILGFVLMKSFTKVPNERQASQELSGALTQETEQDMKKPTLGDQMKSSKEEVFSGEVVIGFRKGVSPADAVAVLSKFGLKFAKTNNVNMGKVFFNETGERFIVKVPEGQEGKWIESLSKENGVYGAGPHYNPAVIHID
ncbi:MAG: hypothetical protein HY548_05795 [Elusimicrobia bacterium]|nr:hypothetical protein [Elusimicrobiota bacterium]